jgi:hypothetical protein
VQVSPLPPLPAEYRGKFFGAVGSLAALSENESAEFRVDEPLTIRNRGARLQRQFSRHHRNEYAVDGNLRPRSR